MIFGSALVALVLVTTPAFGQTPKEATGPHSPNNDQEESSKSFQSLRYLRNYHFAENAKKHFLITANKNPKATDYQECINCIADQFTNEKIEPYFNQIVFKYLSLQQLIELNNFLESPLGKKMINLALSGGGEDQFKKIMTRDDLTTLQKISQQEFYKATMRFNQYGLPSISNGEVSLKFLREFQNSCKQFPHPW